jgi:hypothetical protein
MKRMSMAAALAVGSLGFLTAGSAQAQFGYVPPPGSPSSRPAVSPYLNLLRPGATPGVNYSTLVRPQIDYGRAIQQLQYQQVQDQQILLGRLTTAPLGYDPTQALPLTGHASRFQYFGSYYSMGGMGAARPGGQGGASPIGVRR